MRKTILVALISFSFSSCLDINPQGAILENEAMKTFEDAEQTLTGIYAGFKSARLHAGYLTLAPDIQADLVHAVDGYTNVYGNIWQWDILSTTGEIEAVYASLYGIIGNCNFYLDQVDEVRASITDDETLTVLDYYTGEAYCARAMAYSELLKMYCEAYDPLTAKDKLGLVLRSTYFQEETARRATLEESYNFVVNDLKEAERLLNVNNDEANYPYFTQAAAYALHARVALYMQDWDAAIEYSSKVIDHENKIFKLASPSGLTTADNLGYMWQYDTSAEIIWKIGYTINSYAGALGSVFLNFTTDYSNYYPDYVPSNWVLNLYDAADGRYKAYFTTLQTGYPHGLNCPLLTKYFGNRNFVQNRIYHVVMPKPLRLAEQYLIRAEAYCRAVVPNYSAASKDFSTLRQARYTTGGARSLNETNWLEEISKERVRELYMEGFRLHDLKRWNLGFERKPQTNTLPEGSSLKIEAGNPLFVWPIPKHEIESPGSEVLPNESNR